MSYSRYKFICFIHSDLKLYEYRPTRKGQNAAEFLKGYTGYLVCDGYDGYNKLTEVTRCGCWAHARRKFLEAMPDDEELKKTSKAKEGFEKINRIFEFSLKIKDFVNSLKAFFCL